MARTMQIASDQRTLRTTPPAQKRTQANLRASSETALETQKRRRITRASSPNKGIIVLADFSRNTGLAQVGEFEWSSFTDLGNPQCCKVICCQPKDASRTILWSCSAAGTFVETKKGTEENTVFHFWNALFGNRATIFSTTGNKYDRWMDGISGEIHVNIVASLHADLSKENNPLITNPEDAVKLKIENQEIWVSKKELTFHSHYFDVLFNGDFKEKAEDSYELKDVKLEDFLLLLGIVHGLTMPINERSVEGLLKLGDFFQLKPVLDRCSEFLKHADIKPLDKLELALQFKLGSTLTDIIAAMKVEELKNICVRYDFPDFARDLMLMKLCLKEF
ncbi:hypothetical protein L596_013153 [Steinernema carpocapsae]|uniref:BTB domain-containing protein n=1 Tax=Steinernema carpocapsae TaxID=34508 RepID=A0A4U5NZC8_STECR|nr:hypothetical protein L596_013153 [Steinernema carpocapsae]